MGFRSLWPLALLVLVPVIILLYILKQEARQQAFSSTMLWQEVYRNMEATKPWEKLKKNLLMILQILTVILFVLALMGPWLKSMEGGKSQAILVLDNSASMGTFYDEKQTRLEAAKEAACNYVDSLPMGAVMHVISGNQQAVLVLSNSTDKTEAKNRIQKIEQSSLAGDLSVSLGLVQSCVSQSEDAQVVFFTDTAFDRGDLEASVESFYSEMVNLSVDSVSYARKEEQILVLAQLTNDSGQTQTREVNLYGEDAEGKEMLLDIASVEIPAGESQSVYFELDADGDAAEMQVLRAELNEKDALAGDNSAWCVLDEENGSRVLLVTESNLFVEKALTNLSGIELYRTSDKKLAESGGSPDNKSSDEGKSGAGEGYDLYIFDGMIPDVLPVSGSLLFINCEYGDLFANCGKAEGKMLTFVDSEVTSYISGCTFGVNQSNIYDIPGWGTGFLKVGEKSAGFYGIYDGRRIGVIGFDLHQTDLGLQAEFPVLMSGLANYLLDSGLTEQNSYTAGESVMLHGSTRGSELTLVKPDGEKQMIEASEASGSYLQVSEPGVYQISQKIDDTVKQQKFVVGFPSALESSVESAQSMTEEGENGVNIQTRAGAVEMRNYILLLLLVLMVAEWILYIKLQ